MSDVPSLISLCIDAIKKDVIYGDELLPSLYEIPSHLFDCLLAELPAVALQKIQEKLPWEEKDDAGVESVDVCFRKKRKRKRCIGFDVLWKKLYESRWPNHHRRKKKVDWLGRSKEEQSEMTMDWQQIYWEKHLQDCLDEAAAIALIPSFDGYLGDITVSEFILKAIGYERPLGCLQLNSSNLSYHCQKFGAFARYLSLQNVLCNEEICKLLNNSTLKGLELWGIKSKEHVNGLCRLLRQNKGTLKSIALSHCKLSSTFVDEICHSLLIKGQLHGIKHFSIKSSRFSESNQTSSPRGIATFLASGRLISSLIFSDDQLGPNEAGMILTNLLDTSSRIEVLDLSENHITGWLTHFRRSSTALCNSSLEFDKSLSLLYFLNLRACNMHNNDIKNLQNALLSMPNLKTLDISDNSIGDQGIKNLVPGLVELSKRHSCIANLKVENCDLSSEGVAGLLTGLSTLKQPLESLSVRENDLGRAIGTPLGKFLGTGIQVLNIEEIGLGPNGFLEAVEEIKTDLNLISINLSKNRGGTGMVIFLKKLISRAPQLVVVNAGFNFMPVESLSDICSAMKIAKGKLEQVDLTGNLWSDKAFDISFLDEFCIKGKPVFKLPRCGGTIYEPYDDEP